MATKKEQNNGCMIIGLLFLAVFGAGRLSTCTKDNYTYKDYSTSGYKSTDTTYKLGSSSDNSTMNKSTTEQKPVTRPHYRNHSSNHHLLRGPRGGCYYINANGNKVYVDRSQCDAAGI